MYISNVNLLNPKSIFTLRTVVKTLREKVIARRSAVSLSSHLLAPTTYYYPTSDSTIMKQEAKGKSKNRRVYTLHRNNDQQIESM